VLARVGALVDGPGFVPHLSGLENLRLACRMSGRNLPPDALEEAVEFADLGPAIGRKYKTYSHGMRYRLGLAQATLGRPDLLLLDEPTTALDPEHTAQVRRVIQAAAARGITVLFSTHELSEVERVCTDAVVMRQGRAVLSGRVTDLVAEHGSLERAYVAAVDLFGVGRELSGSARSEEHLA
jgi:ABC-2 type transport system ATP-binding protein